MKLIHIELEESFSGPGKNNVIFLDLDSPLAWKDISQSQSEYSEGIFEVNLWEAIKDDYPPVIDVLRRITPHSILICSCTHHPEHAHMIVQAAGVVNNWKFNTQ